MSRKPKFKPEITRVKLNPEQAVLICSCHTKGVHTIHDLYLAPIAPVDSIV